MLARKSTLQLRNGMVVDMPQLVPSFTSKGFPFKENSSFSEATLVLELCGTNSFLDNSFLVSAYDIFHKHLDDPARFYSNPELVFIDSGGYELAPHYDGTEPEQGPYKHKAFKPEDYRGILDSLPKDGHIIITNIDWETQGQSIEDQIIKAQQLFSNYPDHTTNFIIKPTCTTKGELKKDLPLEEIIPHVSKLRAFDIVGVTEKDLGKNYMQRLKKIARLRVEMDRQKVPSPLHIYGGLDPVNTPLYFFVGAEIFDGVSWMRYAFHDGIAVYRDCMGLLEHGIETSMDHIRGHTLLNNLTFLRKLTANLRRFVDSGGRDFKVFDWHGDLYKRTYGLLCSELRDEIPEIQGGK